MTILLLAVLAGFAAGIVLALADSAMRLWSAIGGIRNARAGLRGPSAMALGTRRTVPARVTTRVSFARTASQPLRAAA